MRAVWVFIFQITIRCIGARRHHVVGFTSGTTTSTTLAKCDIGAGSGLTTHVWIQLVIATNASIRTAESFDLEESSD